MRLRQGVTAACQAARPGSHDPEATSRGLPWALVTGWAGTPGPECRPSRPTDPSTHQGRESPKCWRRATYNCVFPATKAPAEGPLFTPLSALQSRHVGGTAGLDPAWRAQVGLLVPSSSRKQQAREAGAGGSGGNWPPASGIPPPTAAGKRGHTHRRNPRAGPAPRKLGQRFLCVLQRPDPQSAPAPSSLQAPG